MGYLDSDKRRDLLYGIWEESEQDRNLRLLAEMYHQGCDAYDRRVCTGTSPRTGDAVPLTPYEFRLINRYALVMHETVVEKGRWLGLTREQVETAIRKYSR